MEEVSDADAMAAAPHDVEPSEVPPANSGDEWEAVDVTTALRRVNDAAREWGVRPHLMEGRFVSALTAAIAQMARVSDDEAINPADAVHVLSEPEQGAAAVGTAMPVVLCL